MESERKGKMYESLEYEWREMGRGREQIGGRKLRR